MNRSPESERIVIIGAGGMGREICAAIFAHNQAALMPTVELAGFIDDGDPDRDRLKRLSVPFLGGIEVIAALDARYVIGIGNPAIRRQIDTKLAAAGAVAANPIVHPRAWVGPDVEIEHGTVVCAGVCITTNVRVGRHTLLNQLTTVAHDCVIGNFVTVAPLTAISGNVTLEDEVELGTGVSIIPGVRIGQSTMVGAGAVVIGNLPPRVVAVGIPARPRSS
jgi:sugar O-acyltransferase (sialic acid O-acetyltransferase NeuD family)